MNSVQQTQRQRHAEDDAEYADDGDVEQPRRHVRAPQQRGCQNHSGRHYAIHDAVDHLVQPAHLQPHLQLALTNFLQQIRHLAREGGEEPTPISILVRVTTTRSLSGA